MRLRLASLGPVLALLLGASCSNEFLPPSYLHELRVLALEASPLEAGPGERVKVRPRIYLPAGESLTLARWSFCPIQLGSEAGNRCVDARCESELVPAADGSLEVEPVSLALACAASLGLPAGAPTPGASSAAASLESVVRGELRSSAGVAREAVLRLPLYPLAPPPSRNRPPAIVSVRLGGEALPLGGGTLSRSVRAGSELALELEVDAASMDRYVDEAGRERSEEPLLSFFATAGRFEDDRLTGLVTRTTWRANELEAGQDRALLYVVARDLRGGQTALGPFELRLER